MFSWLQNLFGRQTTGNRSAKRSGAIPDAMWMDTLRQFPFLARRSIAEQFALRDMTEEFLARKQFTGAGGLIIDDDIAIAIAAQACLPVLHLGLKFYDDFKGIEFTPAPCWRGAKSPTSTASCTATQKN